MTSTEFNLSLLALGALSLLVVWLPLLLRSLPLSLPIVCTALGFTIFRFTPLDGGFMDSGAAERVTQIVIVIALMGAGLKIDRPWNLGRWQSTWRLLGIGMPLMIVVMMLLFRFGEGFSLPAALLLAAAFSPTDPVLASGIGVGPPAAATRARHDSR